MAISTLVLDTNAKALKEYFDYREKVVGNAMEGQIFDNIFIACASARISKEEWDALLQIATRRFNDAKVDIAQATKP